MRGATNRSSGLSLFGVISTHTPLTRRDTNLIGKDAAKTNFYTHTSQGATVVMDFNKLAEQFLLSRPAERNQDIYDIS